MLGDRKFTEPPNVDGPIDEADPGLRSNTVDPIVCLGCHTPDQNLGPFAVAAAMKEVVGPGHGLPP